MSKKRRSFSVEFKAEIALEAISETETINQIASRHDVLPVQVSQWKKQLLESLPDALGSLRSTLSFRFLGSRQMMHKILAWELSNSMDINLCIRALKRALASNPAPLVINSDQGSQITGQE